jgi:hypothetical protein
MNRFVKTLLMSGAMLASVTLVQGCATSIKASSAQNPPPAQAFSAYGRIQVKPVVFAPGVSGNTAALAKIDQNLQHDLVKVLPEWNAARDNGRTLVIEPVVEQMSFKGSVGRVLLGPLMGSSGVLMRLNIRDDKGNIVATPQFFQRANAMAAGWTFGVHDNLMLMRVANLSSGYIKANYASPVGGRTGGDDPVVAP